MLVLVQVPIVASTGGLVDTVKEGFTGFQMGGFNVEVNKSISTLFFLHKNFSTFVWVQVSKISFQCEVVDPADVQAIATTVTRALGTYGTPAFTEIIGNCMAQDLSWKVRNLS